MEASRGKSLIREITEHRITLAARRWKTEFKVEIIAYSQSGTARAAAPNPALARIKTLIIEGFTPIDIFFAKIDFCTCNAISSTLQTAKSEFDRLEIVVKMGDFVKFTTDSHLWSGRIN